MRSRTSFQANAFITAALCACAVSAYSQTQQQPAQKPSVERATPAVEPGQAASIDALPGLDARTRKGIALQVALDRAGFSPGEIDGAPGLNTERALAAYKAAKGTSEPVQGETSPVAQYAISADDVAGPFVDKIPADMMEKAKLPSLGYSSVLELLAERFHASQKLLQRLNPDARFVRGEVILVPNVEPFIAPGLKSATDQTDATPAAGAGPPARTDAARAAAGAKPAEGAKPAGRELTITVTDRTKTLEVTDASGAVLFHAPVTVGSENDPLPVGEWKVNGVSRNPVFNYNPKLFWDGDPSHAKAKIPAGPNNPVGVAWIDLSKEHYGIHGTPEPSRIGYTESHGCIRLSNWDVTRLAAMVSPGTKVVLR
jgi:lipoprotein-anchoring transpeptidase ErfK/SrfK